MLSRTKRIVFMYLFPMIGVIVFPIIGGEVIFNNEPLGIFGLAFCGFVIGMCIEGATLIIMMTIAAITGKLDD